MDIIKDAQAAETYKSENVRVSFSSEHVPGEFGFPEKFHYIKPTPLVNANEDWTPRFVKPTPSKTGRDWPAGGPAGGRGSKPAPTVIDLKISDRDMTLQVNTICQQLFVFYAF